MCGNGVLEGAEACDNGQENSDILAGACRTTCVLPSCGDGVVDPAEACDDGANNSDEASGACRTTCALGGCGDGVVDPGEQCDLGPANSNTAADTCRRACVNPSCGDGVVDTGEACDDGGNNADARADACRTTCVEARCGDGTVDTGEACDDGPANSDTTPGACRTACAFFRCGDGVVDPGEACDDGPNNSDTIPGACRTTCSRFGCGDGILDPGEACDDGPNNSDTAVDACRTTCVAAACGDGVVDTGETCDDGPNNSNVRPDACRTACTPPACGDGVIDTGETCDDGARNSDTVPDACRTTCTAATCGDGVLDTGERCDDGLANSSTVANACRPTCVLAFCGDGVVDTGEVCDQGTNNSDALADRCRTTCVEPRCGDNVADTGEACDEGTRMSATIADRCRPGCIAPACGDGVMDTGEACDDGANNSATIVDACRPSCAEAGCGDGVVDTGEACDLGAANSSTVADTCRETCVDPSCGDGVVDTGEACDDGLTNSSTVADACRPGCIAPSCGDGVVDSGETCDDGPSNSDALPNACRSTCTRPACGDGVVDPAAGEVCDDGNVIALDGCSPTCQDENECLNGRATCPAATVCVNTNPGFRCDCASEAFAVASGGCFRYALAANSTTNTSYTFQPQAAGLVDNDRFPDLVGFYRAVTGSAFFRALGGDGAGDFTRLAGPSLSTSQVSGVALANIDGAGPDDWIALNYFSVNRTTVWYRDGTTRQLFGGLTEGSLALVGDVDNDRIDEVIIERAGSFEVYDGSIRRQAFPRNGINLFALRDLDGDGDRDLIGEAGNTYIFFNSGPPGYTFGPQTPLFGISGRYAGDADADGDVDLMSADATEFYPNDGRGQFAAAQATVWGRGFDPFFADINGDGREDYAHYDDRSRFRQYTATSSRTFADGQARFVVRRLNETQFTDVNADGALDAVIKYQESVTRFRSEQRFYTLLGGPDGIEAPLYSISAAAQYAVIGDIDHDGHPDVFTIERSQLSNGFRALTNDGTGVFVDANANAAVGSPAPSEVRIVDFDGDGLDDLYVRGAVHAIFAGVAGGTFERLSSGGALSLADPICDLADFDRDGDLDAVTCGPSRAQIYVGQNRAFTAGPVITGAGAPLAIGEINGDGLPDVVANAGGGTLVALTGTTAGTVNFAFTYAPSFGSGSVVRLTDLNGDRRDDLLAYDNTTVFWAPNTGGGFGPAQTVLTCPAVSGVFSLNTADLDGDGRRDVIMLCGREVVMALNRRTRFELKRGGSMGATDLRVDDFDGDGRPDLMLIGRGRVLVANTRR